MRAQNNLLQRCWQDFLKVKPENFLNMSLCHHDGIIADLRDRATDLLYSIVKYCLDVVSDAKAQTDLISGLKEKVGDLFQLQLDLLVSHLTGIVP